MLVTNCSTSNALNYSMVFWDEIDGLVSGEYPDIRQDFALVDALTMWFVKNPECFDAVAASNLFADIITDRGRRADSGHGRRGKHGEDGPGDTEQDEGMTACRIN